MSQVIAEIVDQHAEEAAFLWLLRENATSAPHYTLADLARLDGRVEAHLDGLATAGAVGWATCEEALVKFGEPGEVFVAAALAVASGDPKKFDRVAEIVSEDPLAARALASGIGWNPYERAAPHIRSLLQAGSPVLNRAGVMASTLHRIPPGPALLTALGSDDHALRTAVIRAAGELGLVDTHLDVRANLKAEELPRRFWAAWSTVILTGHRDGIASLRAIAEAGGPFAERAAALVMRKLTLSEARLWHKHLTTETHRLRASVAGIGALGDPAAIPWLIEQMKSPPLARIAGEAFSMITGAHIAYDKLEGHKPDGFQAGPTEDPDDENVAMDPDESLAWPDPQLVQKCWSARRGEFAKDTRYLLGRPIAEESLQVALRRGYQRQRHSAAMELALLRPGKPLFNVSAPGFLQQKLLK
jgi:uncharacterized protein (TIGR02270 family)